MSTLTPQREALQTRRIEARARRRPRAVRICATGCRALGALDVHAAFATELAAAGLADSVDLLKTGCQGPCVGAPVIGIDPDDIVYRGVTPDDVPDIVRETLVARRVIPRLAFQGATQPIARRADLPFFASQSPVVLRRCGRIDPADIDSALEAGAYSSLERVLDGMSSQAVIDTITASGLRGRGGAGYPTGRKWEATRDAPGDGKYLVCNADEGDPGAFMDRAIVEGDPHAVIEGMLIAAYAIGADEGYVYVRAEYPIALEHMRIAIEQARAAKLLGGDILGSGFAFDLTIKVGAGAFVCGEETALLASLEGRRGQPRPRPPFPAQRGLWDRPTNINNVETYANVPAILDMGAETFAAMGTTGSGGAKLFALAGKVRHTGLVEVPMGATLRRLVEDIGGGVAGELPFKAAQIGGPSGGCVPARFLDLPIDYESVKEAGAIMGSGGLIVLDEATCMVDLARFFLDFCTRESCGKCPPCRIGTARLLDILQRLCAGEGRPDDLTQLEELALQVKQNSLCGLGQTAANPVLSTLRHFPDEYQAHLEQRCPAKTCTALIVYRIAPEKCTGCTVCAKHCPVNVISGRRQEPHTIDATGCIKCGACLNACNFDAVEVN